MLHEGTMHIYSQELYSRKELLNTVCGQKKNVNVNIWLYDFFFQSWGCVSVPLPKEVCYVAVKNPVSPRERAWVCTQLHVCLWLPAEEDCGRQW